jgi:hypothetical protein
VEPITAGCPAVIFIWPRKHTEGTEISERQRNLKSFLPQKNTENTETNHAEDHGRFGFFVVDFLLCFSVFFRGKKRSFAFGFLPCLPCVSVAK